MGMNGRMLILQILRMVFTIQKKAKAEFAKAKSALQAEGVTFPIHLDMPVDQTATTKVQRVQSMKQSLEATLGADNVVIDIQQLQKRRSKQYYIFC